MMLNLYSECLSVSKKTFTGKLLVFTWKTRIRYSALLIGKAGNIFHIYAVSELKEMRHNTAFTIAATPDTEIYKNIQHYEWTN